MLKIKSFAKINIGLEVLYKRDDGFHEINTVFAKIGLFDEIIIEPYKELFVECIPSLDIHQEQNLAYKSGKLIQNLFACKSKGAKITILKKIPLGGGLGGGSSNAAYVMIGLNKFWDINASESELQRISSQLGSDVPFFFGGNFAIGKGKGEILEYFDFRLPYHILLVIPKVKINTTWAYSKLDRGKELRTASDLKKIFLENINHPEKLKSEIKNDFEEVIFKTYPELKIIREKLYENGAIFSQMSGSGSSIFGFFNNLDELLYAQYKLAPLCDSIIIKQDEMS
jgi:4-diphosphocytidyl-2-C-methyl-D-erythritol kinase